MKEVVQTYIDHLRAADEQLASLVDTGGMDEAYYLSLGYTYIFDLKGRFLYASPAIARVLGLKQQDFIGKTCFELSLNIGECPELTQFAQAVNTVIKQGSPLTMETAFPTIRGKRYYEYRLIPLREAGQMIAVLCTVRDITDRKAVELQYRGEAAKLRQLIEICPLAVLVVDRAGTIITVNHTYLQALPALHGLSVADLIGKHFNFISERTGITFDQSIVGRVLATGGGIANEYVRLCEREWLVNAFPTLHQETGEVTGAVALFLEVTDLEEWRRENSRIERLQLIGEMATGVAHEIRNPMTVVRGFLQVLMARSDVKMLDYFQLILEELDRINAVVTDFLAMATNKTMKMSEQSLNEIIHAVYPLLYNDAAKQGIEFDIRLAGNLPKLLLDEREIKQLIINLVRNSVEAINSKGKILLKTNKRENAVELLVADNGSGIAADRLQKIFDPFYTTKATGTGLGLPVCQGIVHRHGGTIQVKSQLGQGTEVLVTFYTDQK